MRTIIATTVTILMVNYPSAVIADQKKGGITDESARASLGETRDQVRFRSLVNEASEAYESIVKGPQSEVPRKILTGALCIGVIPNLMTGAFVVGGTHGEGLVSCKDKNGEWSQPATISLNQGSVGLQAGAKIADMVLFFRTTDAVEALKKGNFTLGTDVSAVAGSYDANISSSDAGVIVYSRSDGLFAGVSVNGSKVGKEQDMLERYYGERIDYSALLEGRQNTGSRGYTVNLTKLFPRS